MCMKTWTNKLDFFGTLNPFSRFSTLISCTVVTFLILSQPRSEVSRSVVQTIAGASQASAGIPLACRNRSYDPWATAIISTGLRSNMNRRQKVKCLLVFTAFMKDTGQNKCQVFLIFTAVWRYMTFENDTNICTGCSRGLTIGVMSIPTDKEKFSFHF